MIVIEERKICRMLEGLFQFDKECEWNDAIEEAMHRFVILPTIDAEPVIRCKDCEYFSSFSDGGNGCYNYAISVSPDHFCSSAERRTDERSD